MTDEERKALAEEFVRAIVREHVAKPIAQAVVDALASLRAAQEGDLPPLLTDERIERIAKTIPLKGCDRQTMGWGIGYSKESDFLEPNVPKAAFPFARAIESEVRTAIAAAGGGVPLAADWFAVAMNAAASLEDAANCLRDVDAQKAAFGAAKHVREKCNALWLASSPQPEAAPAVAQVPLEWRDWVEGVRDDILYPLAHRENDELSHIAEGLGQRIPNLLEMSAPEAPAQADNLTAELQQRCSDWGVYWRAPDAHGVVLTVDQAIELLRDALGVEVEIKESKAAPSAGEVERDTVRLNYLQSAGATVEILPGRKGNWRFRVGGRNEAVSHSIRIAIDAALSHKEQQP